jgi:hypothetical protein
MMILLILNVLVYQNGDTLLFTEQDSVIDQWILDDIINQTDSVETKCTRKAKVSSTNERFFVYIEQYEQGVLVKTEIILYNNFQKELWRDSAFGEEVISFKLSNVYDNLFIVVRSLRGGNEPILYTVKHNLKETIIKKGSWNKIINYSISPNRKYLLLHTKNPYAQRNWDYIYFVDLINKKEWQYLFPMCASCKRNTINLAVDNKGISEIMSGGEHRIFSKDGKFIDYFISFD